ncbi:DUF5615 family PIN-like protein [Brevundimonas sp. VNH65]|uniref:DUF5615 family PIN-like protein n=1 Tax=Brevundimonas sp. VNH65 TaxID=3400917 RepID=UPI003C0D73C2
MKFLLDEHLPTGLCALIAELGHEALHVKTLGWRQASDIELWRSALALDATVMSKDHDFLVLAQRDGRTAGLLHLNVGNISNRSLHDILRHAWPRVIERLEQGDVIVEVRP